VTRAVDDNSGFTLPSLMSLCGEHTVAAVACLTLSRPLLQVGLRLVNSVMILNRKRFLAQHGLDDLTSTSIGGNPLQSQVIGLLHAVQYLKVPVIIANILTIAFEIFFGG
jgi:hypothetical protein